jgi:2-methylfumaryl-CoA isomerase
VWINAYRVVAPNIPFGGFGLSGIGRGNGMDAARPLSGLRIIEGASFVAAPSAGMALAQLGADVIRVDPPGGGSDALRWPLAPGGASLFWANLNKGKRSVSIDYRSPEGRELLIALVTVPGPDGGILIDNMVGRRRLTYEELAARRADVIHLRIEGRADGSPAVDYTVNAEVGVPDMTGPHESGAPVNHVVPAWDLLTGMTAATAILAAVRQRSSSGEGARIELALADVALAGVGSMGWLAEADLAGRARPRHGNHVFGSFGVDFQTADGRRVMVVALTEGQWQALRDVTETGPVFVALEQALDADLSLEADRYRLRETIAAVLRPWFAQRDFTTVSDLLTRAHVLWSPYRDMAEAASRARHDRSPLVEQLDQPGIGPMLATGNPLRWDGAADSPVPAPRLGDDTERVLSEILGLTQAQLGELHAKGVIAVSSAVPQ